MGSRPPETFAATEAAKFAPVKGDEGAKGGPGSATLEIVSARESPDGRYYRVPRDSIYPLRFWGVAAIGPGQVGGARKLARRDVVQVTCQMPEDKAAPEDYQLPQSRRRHLQKWTTSSHPRASAADDPRAATAGRTSRRRPSSSYHDDDDIASRKTVAAA